MAVDVLLGLGTRFYLSIDGGTIYTELADMEEIGPTDDGKVDQVEVTPLNPTNRRKEYKPGLVDGGNFNFKQKWNKLRFSTYRGYLNNNLPLFNRIVFPDNPVIANASKVEFQGNLTKWRPNGFKRMEQILIEAEEQVTGDVTFTAGT